MNIKDMVGIETLEEEFGVMTVGLFIKCIRKGNQISQTDFAKRLKLSKANLCDIEKGRKLLSPGRAAKFAKALKVPEVVLIKLAIQDLLRSDNLNYEVEIQKVS